MKLFYFHPFHLVFSSIFQPPLVNANTCLRENNLEKRFLASFLSLLLSSFSPHFLYHSIIWRAYYAASVVRLSTVNCISKHLPSAALNFLVCSLKKIKLTPFVIRIAFYRQFPKSTDESTIRCAVEFPMCLQPKVPPHFRRPPLSPFFAFFFFLLVKTVQFLYCRTKHYIPYKGFCSYMIMKEAGDCSRKGHSGGRGYRNFSMTTNNIAVYSRESLITLSSSPLLPAGK